MATRIDLLPARQLIKTGPVDEAAWNYLPVLGWLQRRRFELVVTALGPRPIGDTLEVGYGSGVFMPTLRRLGARRLCGVDVHPHHDRVRDVLRQNGIEAELHTGGAETLPFPAASFDTVVAISALEFIEDLRRAAQEMARVLRPTGRLIFVAPRPSPLADAGLRLLTSNHAPSVYADRRERLLPVMTQYFRSARRTRWPRLASGLIGIYECHIMRPLPQAEDKAMTSAA